LIIIAFHATPRSAIDVSAVSPDRLEIMGRTPWRAANAAVRLAPVTVPTWLGLMIIARADFFSMPTWVRA